MLSRESASSLALLFILHVHHKQEHPSLRSMCSSTWTDAPGNKRARFQPDLQFSLSEGGLIFAVML